MKLVLPQSTVILIEKVDLADRHPGLQLDKFSMPGDQETQKAALDAVRRVSGHSVPFADLTKRRRRIFASLPGVKWICCETTGPLTLHLSRASALENAGICLHPLYGFTYLPGSGLKGMARAYAQTIWLPVQSDQEQAWRQIEDVFGWAPNPDRARQIKDDNHPATVRRKNDSEPESPAIKASCGAIVFHDAWPTDWPKLYVDIINNHHPHYYTGKSANLDNQKACAYCRFAPDDPNAHPPGDWENPMPVYFLAVKPGTTFTFPLSKRRADAPDDLLALAQQWLLGALCHLGAGAKTNAGYGAFKPANNTDTGLTASVSRTWQAATTGSNLNRAVFETTLELVTPAFLAGANQIGDAAQEGCDLRPATLRGQLRWWWRTMHSGFVDVRTLRALEAAIWGDTRAGGAVRIVIEKNAEVYPQPYDKQANACFEDKQKRSEWGILGADPKKTTQGLWYVSYGMDDANKRRLVLVPPASWRIQLIARPTRFVTDHASTADTGRYDVGTLISSEQVLKQAQAAMWLLCHFGGVGAKARKGFGSLAADKFSGWDKDKCENIAEEFRAALRLSGAFNRDHAHSSSLKQILAPIEIAFPWSDVWQVLDQIGFAYQAFAKKYKHSRQKMGLGLPRRIGPPAQGTFSPRPPVTLNGRHSSPVHIHVARSEAGWLVRAVAFPAAYLPDLETSAAFLTEFRDDFSSDLKKRAALPPPPSRSGQPKHRQSQQVGPSTSLPRPGDRVEAVLLEEKTKKGGWKARHESSGLSGPIQNSPDVPSDRKPGDKITLIVASAKPGEIAYRYPTPADEQRASRPRGNNRGGGSKSWR